MIVWLAACSSGSTETARQRTLAALADELTAPAYEAFAARAVELHATTRAFCENPDEDGLNVIRDAWRAARLPFKRVELVQFGPIVDNPLRVGPKVDLWPVRQTVVDDFLAESTELAAGDVADFGGSLKGFPVMEYLLWHPGGVDVGEGRTCTFLTGIAQDLERQASALRTGWETYRPHVVTPGVGRAYTSEQAVLDEWVNRMFFTVEDLRFEQVGVSDRFARAAPFSNQAPREAVEILRGTRTAFDGLSSSIDSLVPTDRTPVVVEVRSRFDAAQTALAEIPEPWEEHPAEVAVATDALRELQIALQVDLAQALSVTITFNDNDGD